MKKTLIISGFIVVLLILVMYKIFSGHGRAEQENAAGTNPIIPVEVVIARDTSVRYQLFTIGTIRANESVEIVSEINRKVIKILFKEGSWVNQGQLLIKLDDADIIARINKLNIELNLAKANEVRQRKLLEKGGVSQEDYDEILNHRNTLQAEIEVLKVDLSKTEILAPFSGKIGLRSISEGALVNPGLVLASLQDISRVKIDFSIPERYANDIRPGATVLFTTDYATDPFHAIVEAVEPAVDLKTRTIQIRALCDNRKGQLVAGTSAKVSLDLKGINASLFLPTAVLVPSIKGYNVFLFKAGKAEIREVRIGLRNKESVQILQGLLAGDTVIATNLLRLKKDAPLRIIKIN